MARPCPGKSLGPIGRGDGPMAGMRVKTLCEYRPEWASSQPASPPLRCTASVINALVRTSSSVHSRAEALGVVSEDGCTVHHSVHTTAQPPSAFIPRIAAWVRG